MILNPATSYFPTTESCIISSDGLNYRVRDGNGFDYEERFTRVSTLGMILQYYGGWTQQAAIHEEVVSCLMNKLFTAFRQRIKERTGIDIGATPRNFSKDAKFRHILFRKPVPGKLIGPVKVVLKDEIAAIMESRKPLPKKPTRKGTWITKQPRRRKRRKKTQTR